MAAMQDAPDRIPISVLTGFLGSGKTTLLAKLVKRPEMSNTALVINEFGEVGIDHMLVEKSDESVVVLDSGCLCCTVRSDLADTLRELLKRRYFKEIPQFDRVMIETTGLADPAPILHTLMTDPVIAARYRLDSVITTVDAETGSNTLDKQPESVKQAAVADRLLLTKTDIATPEKVAALEARIAAINPAADPIRVIQGEINPDLLFGAGLWDPSKKIPDVAAWLREEAYADGHDHHHHHDHDHGHDHGHEHHDHGHDHEHQEHGHGPHHHQHAHDVNRHDDHIRSFCIRLEEPMDWDRFVDFMEALISTHGDNLLRVKGILNIDGAKGPVAIHGVQHVFHPPAMLPHWPDSDHGSRIVMICRDIAREPVEKMLKAFLDPDSTQPLQ